MSLLYASTEDVLLVWKMCFFIVRNNYNIDFRPGRVTKKHVEINVDVKIKNNQSVTIISCTGYFTSKKILFLDFIIKVIC
jgi:hypothetical protein